ncbi:response regulator [Paraburkholderia sp. C35]|uniref:response regulator transcription factor n=1 Tax=Paraburkholderia sp. C35 TaxID=2126993 RepID=UPI000D69BF6D|nr:response regulator [Paraburkholderia sp. C35]
MLASETEREPEAASTTLAEPVVFIVDDDVSVRESLQALIHYAGLRAETYASARDFLKRPRAVVPNCLVLDVRLPDIGGLELQRHIASQRKEMPIIFITGYGDVPMTVQAMKAGAVEFLTKPFDDEILLRAVRAAIARSRAALGEAARMSVIEGRYASLSRREREVMALVVSGLLNKQVGFELGISEITVKAHRRQVMQKMNAITLADLINAAQKLQLGRTHDAALEEAA